MSAGSVPQGRRAGGMRRIRLSQWARGEGISRITAYRMLRRGVLPVPAEKSPTGRWYVLVSEARVERMAFYTRATRSPDHALSINDQIAALSEWAAHNRRRVDLVVREVATPHLDPMPKLAQLLADSGITEIVIENPGVVGDLQYRLLVAALAPQGRSITVANTDRRSGFSRRGATRAAIVSLCQRLYGQEAGLKAAQRALTAGE